MGVYGFGFVVFEWITISVYKQNAAMTAHLVLVVAARYSSTACWPLSTSMPFSIPAASAWPLLSVSPQRASTTNCDSQHSFISDMALRYVSRPWRRFSHHPPSEIKECWESPLATEVLCRETESSGQVYVAGIEEGIEVGRGRTSCEAVPSGGYSALFRVDSILRGARCHEARTIEESLQFNFSRSKITPREFSHMPDHT